MSNTNGGPNDPGSEVLKAIGSLNEVVNDSKNQKDNGDATPEDIVDWIVVIGKAILSLFKH